MNVPHERVVQLQCRGGAGYEFSSLGLKAAAQGDARVAVAMVFAASDRAAGARNETLQPGTCAPSDRPLAQAEPRELHFITAAFAQPFAGPIDISARSAERRPDVRSIAEYLKDPAHYWTFTASDTHHGYFDVTLHEFWIDRSAPPPMSPPPPAPLAVARWLLRVSISGGIAGSQREVSINGEGRLQLRGSGTFGNVNCTATIGSVELQRIEAAFARAHPDRWPKAYPMKGNGCCDQLQYVLHLDREDDHGQRTGHETSWISENASIVPEAVSALFTLAYESRHACMF
jgi:hypothetical protein